MKFLLLLLPLIGLAGCVKQKNCDCGIEGKFIYYPEGEQISYCGAPTMIDASFYTAYRSYPIVNEIPKKYQQTDTLFVSVCLQQEKRNGCRYEGASLVYKLKCIEEID